MTDDTQAFLDPTIDAEIERRTARGHRLAKMFSGLPKGMKFDEFLQHPEVSVLELDFITACEMYRSYAEEKP